MKYAFPAVFTKEDNGYSVMFPDVPSCYTDGDTLAEAIENANDVLCLRLYDIEEASESIPVPSEINDVKVKKGQFVSLIACDTLEYRKFYDNKNDMANFDLGLAKCRTRELAEGAAAAYATYGRAHKVNIFDDTTEIGKNFEELWNMKIGIDECITEAELNKYLERIAELEAAISEL